MEHLAEGDLRRWIDDPQSLSQEAQLHLESCRTCSASAADVRSTAEWTAQTLGGDVSPDPARAYERIKRQKRTSTPISNLFRPLAGAAAAAIVVCIFAFTPLGGYASAFLTIFQPKEFVPVDLTKADLQQLHVSPQADQLGSMRVIRRQHMTSFASAAAARRGLLFTPRLPQQLPAGTGSQRDFVVGTPAVYQYTFSAAKAQAFEAKSHHKLPAMPAALNGTTITVRVGEIFGAHYGMPKWRRGQDDPKPGLTVVQMQMPTVTSKGASFQELERYMLAMPGISPDLASELRQLGDLQNRMPVPIDISKQNAQQVSVDGVNGLAIGDNTGLGAGVVWQKNGIVYGVIGGELTMDQALAVANGLR